MIEGISILKADPFLKYRKNIVDRAVLINDCLIEIRRIVKM